MTTAPPEKEAPSRLEAIFAGKLNMQHPAVRASLWTFTSYGAGQVMRLGSNLILTRLLMPEAFGLMLIVHLVIQGVEMFADFGLGQSIVQNKRGEEPAFLRTAWTVQILRSFPVYVIAASLAWPLAVVYEEPMLRWVLPVTALNIILDAFCSAQVGVLNRRLEIGRLVAIDLGTYALMVAVMVVGALFTESVWPLVIGSLVGSGVSTALTHIVLGGIPMRFQLDRAVARQLYTFGRWIFLSTMLTFLCGQLDRVVLGRFMTTAELGVYGIAFMLSQVMTHIVQELSQTVLFPMYARSAEKSREHLRRQTLRFRGILMAVALPPLCFLIAFGPEIIGFLYDDRYQGAGFMLQLLGVGAVLQAVLIPVEAVLMASGDSFRHLVLQAGKFTVLLAALAIGGYTHGAEGIIVGFSVSHALYYPLLAVLVRRYGVWFPWLDALGVAAAGGLVAAGLWLKPGILTLLTG
jgi:O-antigen/teichoic acid export membrane protein